MSSKAHQQSLFNSDDGNPLLGALLPERTFLEWAEVLYFDPLVMHSKNGRRLSESSVHCIDQLFIPTRMSIRLALKLSAMMIASLRRRDPRVAANRKYLFELPMFGDRVNERNLDQIPWMGESASGAILRGPTGCSKTHSCDAFLRLLPQCVEHGANAECGWEHLRQLVYLRVPMPADSSRKGLLINIVWKIDEALGTSYTKELTKQMTQEQLLVKVLTLLADHRCGLLILEEVQNRNVKSEVLGSEFSTVFLKILNSGIPLVLVGNPMSFEHIMSFSQDLRRLTNAGLFDFAPAYDHIDEDWALDLVPGVWGWNPLPAADQKISNLDQLLYDRTGGIPGVLSIYRRETLIEAMMGGFTCVTMAHLDAAFWSPSIVGMHELIDAYKNKDLKALAQKFTDQPVAYLAEIWERERLRRARAGSAPPSNV